jgi:hypothetical protein
MPQAGASIRRHGKRRSHRAASVTVGAESENDAPSGRPADPAERLDATSPIAAMTEKAVWRGRWPIVVVRLRTGD